MPWIVANGAKAFADDRRPTHDPGTTLVQLTGAVAKPGIVEVPLGMTGASGCSRGRRRLRSGRKSKAVLVGGPAGGFLPPAELRHALLASSARRERRDRRAPARSS